MVAMVALLVSSSHLSHSNRSRSKHCSSLGQRTSRLAAS